MDTVFAFLLAVILFPVIMSIFFIFLIAFSCTGVDAWVFETLREAGKLKNNDSKVIFSFRQNFGLVKDLFSLYVQVVVAGYMLKLTPIAIVQFIFRGLLILKALIAIINNIYEHEGITRRA